MTHQHTLVRALAGNEHKPFIGKATSLVHLGKGVIGVYVYTTLVYAVSEKGIYLNWAGWQTPFTKKRLNQINEYLGIYQRDGKWYLKDGTPIFSGIVLDHDLKPIGKINSELREDVIAYLTVETEKIELEAENND